MKIFVLFFIIMIHPILANSYSKNALRGMIFFDYNKNGIIDDGEFGVGGLYIKHSSTSRATNIDGKYYFHLKDGVDFLNNKIVLELDRSYFYDGMIATAGFQRTVKDIQDTYFGVYYPIEVMMMTPLDGKKIKLLSEFISQPFIIKGDLNSFSFTINDINVFFPQIDISLPKELFFSDNVKTFPIQIDSLNLSNIISWEIVVADEHWKIIFKKKNFASLPAKFDFTPVNSSLHVAQIRAVTKNHDIVASNFLVLNNKKNSFSTFKLPGNIFNDDSFKSNLQAQQKFSEFDKINYLQNDYLFGITVFFKSSKSKIEYALAEKRVKKLQNYFSSNWGFSQNNMLTKILPGNDSNILFELHKLKKDISRYNNNQSLLINSKAINIENHLFEYKIPEGSIDNSISIKTKSGRVLKTSFSLLNFRKKHQKKMYVKYDASKNNIIDIAKGNIFFNYTLRGSFKNILKLYLEDQEILLDPNGKFTVPLKLFIGKNNFNFKVIDRHGLAYDFTQILTASFDNLDQTYLNLIVPAKIDFVSNESIYIKGYTNPGNKVLHEANDIIILPDGSFGLLINSMKTKELHLQIHSITNFQGIVKFNLLELLKQKVL